MTNNNLPQPKPNKQHRAARLLLVLFALVAAHVFSTARPYAGLNAGVVWDNGLGIEIKGEPGIFYCGINADC